MTAAGGCARPPRLPRDAPVGEMVEHLRRPSHHLMPPCCTERRRSSCRRLIATLSYRASREQARGGGLGRVCATNSHLSPSPPRPLCVSVVQRPRAVVCSDRVVVAGVRLTVMRGA